MKRTYGRYFDLMQMVHALIVIIDSDPRRENRRAPPLNYPCRPMEQYRPTTGQSLTAWPGARDRRISRVDATVRHTDGAPVDQ